jgi:glyoxylase-like metal-dependent hydrolase (beta-lactamase superfamily II)
VAAPREIVPGVYGLGTNLVSWYLVEDGGRLTAVDAGVRAFAGSLEADLGAIGHSPGDVDAVILTHSDFDHTGVVPELREAGARVLIHPADDPGLRNPGPKSGDASPRHFLALMRHPQFLGTMAHFIRRGALKPAKIEGAETFGDGDVLDLPGRPRVIHTPGHTAGHCVFLFEGRRALFVGDALCTLDLATRSTGPQLMHSGQNESDAEARESLTQIGNLDADVLLPGHGEPWRGSPADAVREARQR